jgi:hypothetical protein
VNGGDLILKSGIASGTGYSNLIFNTTTAGGTNPTEKMRITGAGDVGIGTTTPSQKLEIYHNDATGGIALNRAAGTSSKSEIKFSKAGAELWAIGNDIDNNGGQTFFIWDGVHGFAPILINQYGKVGIGGVTPPDNQNSMYELYVKDGICTRDVKVTAGTFPDYVFEKDYNLPSIYDLENYININKHLPGIPSAQEIKQNEGFEVGDMQQKLTKVVEEQALYIIDLQKQLDELKKRLENLENN